MRLATIFALALPALAVLGGGEAAAQYGYGSSYGSGGYYKPSYYTYPAYSYAYAPTYSWSYWAGGYDGDRWYPAGNYARVNGVWYRQGYGYEYGSPYPPGQHCPAPAPPVAPKPPSADDVLKELLIRKLLADEAKSVPPITVLDPRPVVGLGPVRPETPPAAQLDAKDRELLEAVRKLLEQKK